mmetsp:Transcript_44106/g.64708  ORF Transcript_44106/g.64708 Transcript_44106/m.64708 type:complete len:218 (+) Transcript_44106:53-706(+)
MATTYTCSLYTYVHTYKTHTRAESKRERHDVLPSIPSIWGHSVHHACTTAFTMVYILYMLLSIPSKTWPRYVYYIFHSIKTVYTTLNSYKHYPECFQYVATVSSYSLCMYVHMYNTHTHAQREREKERAREREREQNTPKHVQHPPSCTLAQHNTSTRTHICMHARIHVYAYILFIFRHKLCWQVSVHVCTHSMYIITCLPAWCMYKCIRVHMHVIY